MSGNKHDLIKPEDAPRDDLVDNPGIGKSKGAFARENEPIESIRADHTVEGDVLNDPDPRDNSVDPDRRGRTNA
jgi:hypothetical protein